MQRSLCIGKACLSLVRVVLFELCRALVRSFLVRVLHDQRLVRLALVDPRYRWKILVVAPSEVRPVQ